MVCKCWHELINYDGIIAETKEEAIEIAKSKALEDIDYNKVSPFTRDTTIQRKASEIQKKIKAEQQTRNYTDDRFERVSDRRFYEENHLPIPDSLKKAEERAQQKKELEALKKKIESKLAENSSLSQGKGR